MPFHSLPFVLLCLATLALYYAGPARSRWQHGVLLLASLAFYFYAGLVDTVLLLATVSVNYLAAFLVERRYRWALPGIVSLDLGILAAFKYRAMAASLANGLLGLSLPLPALVIPLGISFYIFQLIAYQVEVGRGVLLPEKSFFRVLLYILFFPHHQAGPIMRPATFLPQFYGVKPWNSEQVALGGLWILWGLAKKVLADNVAGWVDPGFADTANLGGVGAGWSLALAYTLQIYGDFSGYSDIAMGLGLLFGYKLDRNFDQPYLATDPSAFWRRWHVTLSAWLRDYLYIPLGGNRRGPVRTYVNLMLTMILGGLWHGASVMFLFWGFLHGALLTCHRRFPRLFAFRPLGWMLTFGFTIVAWVPFRAPGWTEMTQILSAMFGGNGLGSGWDVLWAFGLLLFILALQGAEEAFLHTPGRRQSALQNWRRIPGILRGGALALITVGIVAFLVDQTTYIYFRF